MTKEYIVSLKKDVNYDEFWNQIENESTDDGFVPTRRVDIVNNRPGSLRSCHYALTDGEADTLRLDPRVYSVELPPNQRTDIEIKHFVTEQSGNFNKTVISSGSNKNWGLRRCTAYNDPYDPDTGSVAGPYLYTNDGTGVDIVIQDSGIQSDHPEFTDYNGSSRVQLINWYEESGLPGIQDPDHYRDFDGHGTHVAGIVAGKTFGFAKNSRIYAVKVEGLEGSGDENTGIPVTDVFDVIKVWHQNKPVDPRTGQKRPTVVNMSWGYISSYVSGVTVNGGNYRGTPWAGNTRRPEYGMIGNNVGFNTFRHNVRVGSVDSDVEELIDAGVIVCIAAGNVSDKIDIPTGPDYDNYYTHTINGNVYYHRGASPHSTNAIKVGSMDSVYSAVGLRHEQKSTFSCTGIGIDMWAPGSNIMSACSNNSSMPEAEYFENPSYKQTNISGTSMASPQVAGVAALYLQSNVQASPAQVKAWLQSQSNLNDIRLGYNYNETDYANTRSLLDANQHILYWPFSEQSSSSRTIPTVSLGGAITMSGAINIIFK